MRITVIVLLSFIAMSLKSQAPVYDDLVFDSDSMTNAYKASSKNFIYIKSKRSAGGVAKVAKADSILAVGTPITDIILVFSETNSDAIGNREIATRERWDNLITTYPQFFQFETNYKNICQCNLRADTAAFRKAQGFYIYFKGKEEPKKAEPKKVEEKKEVATKPKKEEAKEEKPKKEKAVKEEKVVEKEAKPEKKRKEEKVEEVKKEEPEEETVVAAPPKVKKAGYAKPKKAKDPKACRPPCYEGGDEGLAQFFVENVKLSKKEKRHSDDLVCKLRLQLNFDGTIKKSFITGTNEQLNKQVEDAVKNMDNWYACVVNGTTVKSDVTLTLKYYPETHSIKPFETMIVPRPGPKCKCGATDIDLFGE